MEITKEIAEKFLSDNDSVDLCDFKTLEDIEAAIGRFNDKYEGYEITGETLSQSIKARDAARAEMEHGLRINKRIRDVYERGSRLND